MTDEHSDILVNSNLSTAAQAAGLGSQNLGSSLGRSTGRLCWRRILPEDVRAVPPEAGCYAIYLAGCLVYIGSTCNLRFRLMQYRIKRKHTAKTFKTPWGKTESVTIKYSLSKRYGDWLMRELRLIRRLKPSHNKNGKEFKLIPLSQDRFTHGVRLICVRTSTEVVVHYVPKADELIRSVNYMNRYGCFECRGGEHTIIPLGKSEMNIA